MEVILTQDVKTLGKKGQKVTVSDGYARNFLMPRGLAKQASVQALNELKNREAAEKFRKAEELRIAKEGAAVLEGKTVMIKARGNAESGKLFGAVTAKEIAEALKTQYEVDVDKRRIKAEDIKQFGTYEVEIKLHAEVNVTIYVTVHE